MTESQVRKEVLSCPGFPEIQEEQRAVQTMEVLFPETDQPYWTQILAIQ